MVYKDNIPQPGDSPATVSQADLLENFAQLNAQFGAGGDHVAFTAGADNGMHTRIRFDGVIADPTLPDPQAALYLKTIAGDSQLFFENFDVGGAVNVVRQMTGLDITDLVNGGTAGGTLYRMDLPVGVTIYAGLSVTNGTVTFPTAYTTIYAAVVTRNGGNTTPGVVQGVGGLLITAALGNNYNWIAIGTI